MDVLNRVEFAYGSLDEAFPPVDPLVEPYGSRVLVQIRTPKTKTKGGLHLITDARDTEYWSTQVAKVRAVGPNAFKDRRTAEYWPEGAWCAPGDYVRVPKFGGDRWTVAVPKDVAESAGGVILPDEKYEALMVIFNDTDIIGKITGDPLAIKAFL